MSAQPRHLVLTAGTVVRVHAEVSAGDRTAAWRMALLLQSHMLLGHLNGTGDWYEVHPLARRALGLA